MKLLHLTYDFPDCINTDKTGAIKKIIDVTADKFENYCISLNRSTNISRKVCYSKGNTISLTTFGLPKGIFFINTLYRSVKNVMEAGFDIKAFQYVHAHKLTFEGPIAFFIHKNYGIPYNITIQQTDFKILKYKPLLKQYYYKILRQAANIVLISPWMEGQLEKAFGRKRKKLLEHKLRSIPLIVEPECLFKSSHNGRLLSCFHMRKGYLKIKNIYRVLKAVSMLREAGIRIDLDIAGDGPERPRLEHTIASLGLNDQVKLLGNVKNEKMKELMSCYKAFILCSYPETFGMVFIEALNAGLPLIYSKNSGIDGFFSGQETGISVRHDNIMEISRALVRMNSGGDKYRENVRALQENGCLNAFSAESVKKGYESIYAGWFNG